MGTLDTERRHRERSAPFTDAIIPSLVIGVASGAIGGLVWGGVGGRIAMRIITLTSSDAVRGITSDDGFEIGVFSAQTIALLVIGTVLGTVVGLPLGLVRPFLSGRTVVAATGLGAAVALVAGASIVHTDGVDFVFLDPLWLTVGLFVFIPGVWAATVVITIDRITERIIGADIASPPRWTIVIAWLAVAAAAVWGAIELIDDVRELVRLR